MTHCRVGSVDRLLEAGSDDEFNGFPTLSGWNSGGTHPAQLISEAVRGRSLGVGQAAVKG